jgi:hypothetical protein
MEELSYSTEQRLDVGAGVSVHFDTLVASRAGWGGTDDSELPRA